MFGKKKKAAEAEGPQSVEEQIRAAAPADAAFPAEGVRIDREEVRKAEEAGMVRDRQGGYNWINLKKIKPAQRALIIASLAFMAIALFVSGRIDGGRKADLANLQKSIQDANNELVKLRTTGATVVDQATDVSMYHSTDQHDLDDLRVRQTLNGVLRWDGAASRELTKASFSERYHPDQTFLDTLFNVDAEYAGWRYTEDSPYPVESEAVRNFVSSMTGMTAGVSRDYVAIMDITYYTADKQPHVRTAAISYTVYEEGAIGGLACRWLANGERAQ